MNLYKIIPDQHSLDLNNTEEKHLKIETFVATGWYMQTYF